MVATSIEQTPWPLLCAMCCFLLAVGTEMLHWQKIGRLRELVFGPQGRIGLHVRLAFAVIPFAAAGLGWSLVLLLLMPPQVRIPGEAGEVDFQKLKHLVVVLDVSPSMRLRDAGPAGDQSRMQRARAVMESWFRRVPMNEYRVTILATYTSALPVVRDTSDISVVENILNDLPMHFAFRPGETRLFSGLEAAAEEARGWRPDSATVVLVSDGDTVPATGMPRMPPSVSDVVIVGVGDPVNGTFLNGKNSRQDVSTLRQTAARLQGFYHNANELHLPSDLLTRLTRSAEGQVAPQWSTRDIALLVLLCSAALITFLPILMQLCGSSWRPGLRQKTS